MRFNHPSLFHQSIMKMNFYLQMHAKPSFAHRLQTAKMASSRTSAQKCLTHDLRGFDGAVQHRLATLTVTMLTSSCWQLSSEFELRRIFDICKRWANSVSHEFVKKNMVRYMRPHGRFAHCKCKNAVHEPPVLASCIEIYYFFIRFYWKWRWWYICYLKLVMNNKLLLSSIFLFFTRVSSLIMIDSDWKYVPGSHENDEIAEISDFGIWFVYAEYQQICTSDLMNSFKI